MRPGTGNQHFSRKADLMRLIHWAHDHLIAGRVDAARGILSTYRREYERAPASTRRRWKCGH